QAVKISNYKRETNAHADANPERRSRDCGRRRAAAVGIAIRTEQRTVARALAGSAAAAGASVFRGIGIHAPAGNSPHQAGAPVLARLAVPVVERDGPELAFALRTEIGRWQLAGGYATLRIRHKYLSGLWPLDRLGAVARRAACAVLSILRAGGRGCGGGQSGHGSSFAGRAK